MRVGMLVRRFDPAGGGTERDFAAAAQCLARAGYEVRIYAARAAAASWQKIAVRRLPVPLFPRSLEVLGFGLLADRFARREGAVITISFGRTVDSNLVRCEGGAHAAYLEAARQWEGSAASRVRALSPYHGAQCRMEARGFQSPRLKLVLAISRMVAQDLERRFALPRYKIETLYNGVEHQRFNAAPGAGLRDDTRRTLGVDLSSRVVLFIGNGFARKGLGKLLEAWPLCANQTHLLVAGEGRALEKYREMARRLRVERRVKFLGKRDDVAGLLAAADVLALPSLFEAFGNVVLEGMAAGLPVLTSVRCGAAEVLPPQLQPFLVHNPMDPGEIARRLDELMGAPRELGAIAREAAAKFTWQRYGDRLVECVKALAD
jgi:UDP-glucose:(heptosyl)LPS alpha-1,3-glucosyltransferase